MDVAPFIYKQLPVTGGWIELAGRAFFRLTGADRHRYLNGQITQSVDGMAPGEARYACALDAKGGIVADLFFREAEDGFLIDVPAELREDAAARLERYMIADDVMLEDCPDDIALFHFLYKEPPAACLPSGARMDRANRLGVDGYDLIVPATERASLVAALTASGIAALDCQLAEAIRIEHCVAAWGSEILPGTLPHEAWLTRRAVSFTKGCYIGQEVVSRIQSVGSPARLLRPITPADDSLPLLQGDELRPPNQPDAKPCGRVTSTGFSFALDKPVALAYLKRGFHEIGALVEATTPGGNQPPRPAYIISPVAS